MTRVTPRGLLDAGMAVMFVAAATSNWTYPYFFWAIYLVGVSLGVAAFALKKSRRGRGGGDGDGGE